MCYTSLPWKCNEKDCQIQWHLSLYDYDEDDHLSMSEFGDGDWELCGGDLPEPNEIKRAWREYYKDCAETGFDPLHEFTVNKTSKRYWQVDFGDSLGCIVFRGARRRGKGAWRKAEDVPVSLREFLCIEKQGARWVCPDFKRVSDIQPMDHDVWFSRGRLYVRIDEPLPDVVIRREVRRAARNLVEA